MIVNEFSIFNPVEKLRLKMSIFLVLYLFPILFSRLFCLAIGTRIGILVGPPSIKNFLGVILQSAPPGGYLFKYLPPNMFLTERLD